MIWNSPIDMDSPVDMDLPIDMTLPVDMELPCINGEVRIGDPCGLEECISGSWRTTEAFDYCNQHDDDCDGTIDESPVRNATNCCDAMQCFSRSSCEAGECTPLALGVCNFDGDCTNGMNCQDNQCVPNEPTEPSSCESPISVSFFNSNDVSGNSSNSRRSRLNSGCMISSIDPISRNEGYEVVYYLDYPLAIIRPYTFTAAVRVNGVAIPITFSVFSECELGTASLVSCNTNYGRNNSPEDIEVELLLARGDNTIWSSIQ